MAKASLTAPRASFEKRLAICLRVQGMNNEALEILSAAEPLFLSDLYGPRHPETLEFLGALSWSIGKVAGRETEAEKRLQSAFQ